MSVAQIAQDLNDPKRYSAFILQGGLGMPDREYYLGATQAMAATQMLHVQSNRALSTRLPR